MPPYLPVQAVSRSQGVRIGTPGKQVPQAPGASVYVDLGDGNSRRDLQRHQAIGALIVVGTLTTTNVDPVVTNGGLVSAGAGLTVNVTAGDLKNRSTGAVVNGAAATNAVIAANASGNPRIDLVNWDNVSGAVSVVTGTPAASPTIPATPAGKTTLATVAVANGAAAPGAITDVRPRP